MYMTQSILMYVTHLTVEVASLVKVHNV